MYHNVPSPRSSPCLIIQSRASGADSWCDNGEDASADRRDVILSPHAGRTFIGGHSLDSGSSIGVIHLTWGHSLDAHSTQSPRSCKGGVIYLTLVSEV